MKTVDLETWNRKEHFAFFYRMDYPQYNICANIDITRFLTLVKGNCWSFYYAMIFAASEVANQNENFRYRIRKGQVILHDRVHPSFTDLAGKGDDLFKMVTVEMEDTLPAFIQKALHISANQSKYFDFATMAERDDFLYITCIPWVAFTSMTHTISLKRDDSVPRISWGKYFREGERVLLPFSVQVHHALADGNHVGQYFERLQDYLDKIDFSD
jgi:chloramphenicol O-acetyltransferase type A